MPTQTTAKTIVIAPSLPPSDRNYLLSEGVSLPPSHKYPADLIDQYQKLALKGLETSLSMEEQAQFQALTTQIEAIESVDPAAQQMKEYCEGLEARLESIRRKAEMLIDARR